MLGFFVRQKNLPTYHDPNFVFKIIASVTIWSVLPVAVFADVFASLYQAIYFSIMRIPKIPRGKFVKINRHRLTKLPVKQKISCAYCEYVNGLIAWLKALANQTEIYSCAIKYQHNFPGQEYQKDFYEPEEFK